METETKAAQITLGSLEVQAIDLTIDLANVRGRLNTICSAMNGERPEADEEEKEDRAAGSVLEISRRIHNSAEVVVAIKSALVEIESIVLPEVESD